MPIEKTQRSVLWKGFETVPGIERRVRARRDVTLTLAANYHHVLCVRLCPHARLHGTLNLSGGSELLEQLATIPGLHDFAALVECVDDAMARVHIQSPPTRIYLRPSQPAMQGSPRSTTEPSAA
jgi:hypothetical protein